MAGVSDGVLRCTVGMIIFGVRKGPKLKVEAKFPGKGIYEWCRVQNRVAH
jgi:hypothetical protein